MWTNNKDLKFLNITISKYDLDRIQEAANDSLREGLNYSSGMAWAEAVMNYLFAHNLLDRTKIKTFNELKKDSE